MEIFADVVVDINIKSVDRVFLYRVPEHLKGRVAAGSRVTVPFGKGNRELGGIVVAVSDQKDESVAAPKDILSVSGDLPPASAQLIRLAGWMRSRYGCTMVQALKTVMPVRKPVKERVQVNYYLTDEAAARQVYEKIKGSKRERARARMLGAMLDSGDGSISRETAAGILRISSSTIRSLLSAGLIREESRQIVRNPSGLLPSRWGRVQLNPEQTEAVDQIMASWDRMQETVRQGGRASSRDMVHLLYGVTGSGKTEVYMELMDRVLSQGRQVIMLIPEISLTLQTVTRFYERFGDRIAVMNSRLSAGERYDQYMKARRGQASIMIGPRSALFTSFEDLGLIIIDEEHEPAYKSESSPKYLARDAAIQRAKLAGAMVVLGSATPSLSSYYKARTGAYSLHRLTTRARQGSLLPGVDVVDLREEFKRKNMSPISGPLREAMDQCLAQGSQIMLFINRRGFAGFVSCRSCGYVFKCRHCDVSMTIHGDGILRCHYCGSEQRMPKVCPSCGSPYIAGFGMGTEKLETLVKKEFPKARVLRLDRDTASGKGEMDAILEKFSEGQADILIGTQMIVKGHDFNRVSLVGIIAADLSMFSGSYLSSERTFQLLTQAAGRAGRGSRPGRVIIQTYRPDEACIRFAAAQDYEAFYEQEIRFRQAMHYPPVSQMLMISIESRSDQEAAQAGAGIRGCIDREIKRQREDGEQGLIQVMGPPRAGIRKVRDIYRYVIYVKNDSRQSAFSIKNAVEAFADRRSGDFRHTYIGTDLDPYQLF